MATAWAWFPLEYAATPRPNSAVDSRDIRLKAPRSLNDPPRWKHSAFRNTLAPTRSSSVRDLNTGVRWTTPSSLRPASTTSSSWITAVHLPRWATSAWA